MLVKHTLCFNEFLGSGFNAYWAEAAPLCGTLTTKFCSQGKSKGGLKVVRSRVTTLSMIQDVQLRTPSGRGSVIHNRVYKAANDPSLMRKHQSLHSELDVV